MGVGSGVAQEGFWLFTRETVADPELIEEMIAVAESLGRDTSVLKPVDQTDCVYEIPENTCQFEGTRCTQNEDCCSVAIEGEDFSVADLDPGDVSSALKVKIAKAPWRNSQYPQYSLFLSQLPIAILIFNFALDEGSVNLSL